MLDLTLILKQLMAKRTELELRIEKLKADQLRLSGPLSADSGERAQEVENDEVVDALYDETEHELNQVRRALVLLKQGEYTRCEACGEEINHDRLKALPYTSLCIEWTE